MFIPTIWNDSLMQSVLRSQEARFEALYKEAELSSMKALKAKMDADLEAKIVGFEADSVIMGEATIPQIGDQVGLMDTVGARLHGLLWYYIGDNYEGDAVVATRKGDWLPMRLSTLWVRDAERYDDAGYARAFFEQHKDLAGKRLKPLRDSEGAYISTISSDSP